MSDKAKPAAEPELKSGKIFALFQNMETRGASLSWAWQGTIYTYEDGKVYQMTQEQIDHLNSLAVMTYTTEVTPEGQVRNIPAGRRNRFSVRPATMAEIKDAGGKAEAK